MCTPTPHSLHRALRHTCVPTHYAPPTPSTPCEHSPLYTPSGLTHTHVHTTRPQIVCGCLLCSSLSQSSQLHRSMSLFSFYGAETEPWEMKRFVPNHRARQWQRQEGRPGLSYFAVFAPLISSHVHLHIYASQCAHTRRSHIASCTGMITYALLTQCAMSLACTHRYLHVCTRRNHIMLTLRVHTVR